MELNGASALVTGGGSGLGKATCQRLASEGAKVAVLDRNGDAANAVAEETGGIGIAADITDTQSVETALDQITEAQGTPRILVNCAGIGGASRIVGRDGPHELDLFERIITVNLLGTFNVLRLVANRISTIDPGTDEERGVIVNTASVAAYEGQIGQAAYSASKGGIVAMALPAAREFSKFGIRVNTVAPGIFHTPLLQGLPPEAQESLARSIPFPSRLGDPAEFADAVHFCITNRYLNGENIRLDGATRLNSK
jgi:NAD(P)-dependent dehydrogenase (short-subunit alcohol dehydrogenase family)